MKPIQMVDLKGQYEKIKPEIDRAVLDCIASTAFINGPQVKEFQQNLENYLGVKHVIPCANGTDALQIALMALDLKENDEIIVPSFTYVATAEVIALLKLKPVMVEVDENTFNITAEIIEKALTPKTKAIVPVHLFGQACDMSPIMELAEKHGFYVVEDNAQAIGSDYIFPDGSTKKAGTIGHIGTTSFFPAKNLGCYGDGGAIFSNDDELAAKMRMIANHGQSKRYYHDMIGVNSRLDSIQAAILDVKLKYLDDYAAARRQVTEKYDAAFAEIEELQTPVREKNSTHVFHQYTLRVKNGGRDRLQKHLAEKGVPANIYYPVPLNEQKAFKDFVPENLELPVTEMLCREVISLPIHTEMDAETQNYIIESVKEFFAARSEPPALAGGSNAI
ncbi:MAG TPA: DegT/DnrJ/EryC1/StrS family aminotransferase [Pyrinomonadaceae bacterium]|nr:DegT/DnrJ/EryC1/StrS family aminotransferase [Pyrinomonadaceae bacterium]